MHIIIQLEQGLNLIWEKIESLISNKKNLILSKLYISTNLILFVNRQILHANRQKCINPKIPCAIYKFHGFSIGVIKFHGFSRLVDTLFMIYKTKILPEIDFFFSLISKK